MRVTIGPLVLIAAGSLLLLSNLGLIPIGQIKELVKQWWPALLILAGVLQLFRR